MLSLRSTHISLLALALSAPVFAHAQDATSSAPPAQNDASAKPIEDALGNPMPAAEENAAAVDAQAAVQTDATLPNVAEQAAAEGHPFIAHLPVSSAPVDRVVLVFDVRGADLVGDIIVYFRQLDDPRSEVRSVHAGRDEKGMRATLPGHLVDGAGFAYWVVERTAKGAEHPVFASAKQPYPLHVIVGRVASREQRLLAEHGGRRSRISANGEWVDLGSFQPTGPASKDPEQRDHYYAFEGQYAYRFFRVIEELEVSLGRLRGRATDTDSGLYNQQNRVGLDYGKAAITFAFGELFRVRTGVLFGVSTRGFEGGFDGALIIGDHQGTEFKLYGSYISHLGGAFGTRLGWTTVPRFPMGARVEITQFPSNDELGVRLLFDAGLRFGSAGMIRLIGGYRGRTTLAGGPSLGSELTYAF